MPQSNIKIRTAIKNDIEAINHVIEATVMSWTLAERVKRLSLSSYRYSEVDFNHLAMVVVEDEKQNLLGVAAWELADAKDSPKEHSALLLHGLYVNPAHHHQGIGRQLFKIAEQAAHKLHCDGLLVKAQPDANAFFVAQKMEKIQLEDTSHHYKNLFWKTINKH